MKHLNFLILWPSEGLLIKDSNFWDYAPMKWVMYRSILEGIENSVLKIIDYIWNWKELDFLGFFEDIFVKHLLFQSRKWNTVLLHYLLLIFFYTLSILAHL